MKRIVVCVVLAVIGVGGSAAPAFSLPLRAVEEGASLYCPLTSDQGTGSLGIGYSDDGYYVTSTVWRSGDTPGEDQPWLDGWDYEAVWDGTTLRATIPLSNYETGGLEQGAVDAELAAAAEPTTWSSRIRVGNAWREERFTQTPATGSGSFIIAGIGEFELTGCMGEVMRTEYFGTKPAAEISNYKYVDMGCRIASGDEEIVVSAWSDTRPALRGAELTVVVFPYLEGEASVYFGTGTAKVTRSSITGTVALTDYSDAQLGTATVRARLAVVDVERVRTTEDGYTTTYRRENLEVAGTLSMPDGRTVDLSDCSATRLTGLSQRTPGK